MIFFVVGVGVLVELGLSTSTRRVRGLEFLVIAFLTPLYQMLLSGCVASTHSMHNLNT